MVPDRLRRATLLLGLDGLVAACSGAGKTRNPDPANQHLRKLAAEPILDSVPPGAVRTSRQEQTASPQPGFFGSAGWIGPGVIVHFTSTQSVRDVHRFYDELAAETGWTPQRRLAEGLTVAWTKQMAGSRGQYLVGLFDDFNTHRINLTGSGVTRSYSLNGSTLSKSLPPQR